MEIDIDSIIDGVVGWDLQLRVGGKVYATRPPLLADLERLKTATEDAASDPLNQQALVKAISAMLIDPDAQIDLIDPLKLLAVTTAIFKYTEEHVSKKAADVAARTQAAVSEAVTGSGKSTAA